MSGQILIVDGSATGRITLKVRLAAACYDPVTARTGDEAMEALARWGPMPVLIGGQPGDMDAIALCTQLVAGWPGLQVVMMVPPERRVAALRAGAAAIFDTQMDEMNLLARMRGLMRDHFGGATTLAGMAEAPAAFDPGPAGTGESSTVLLIAEDAGAAMSWRHALSGRLDAQLRIADPERALAEAAIGLVPDLYLVAGDIAQPGDGLRLLSELRSRHVSRHAAFAVVLGAGRLDMMSVALDLGAGDVLPDSFAAAAAEETALRLDALIRRKQAADRSRAAAERDRCLARTDPLTGLPNRRFALPRLTEICTRALASGGTCAVIAIDIDRFKAVNDRHGHATGDAVLAAVAERMRSVMPASGFIARMGGEEFLAVLPDADDDVAAGWAAALRAAVSSDPIGQPVAAGRPLSAALRITISAGIASLDCHAGGTGAERAAELLEQADAALLHAKRSGRDRLIVSGIGAAA